MNSKSYEIDNINNDTISGGKTFKFSVVMAIFNTEMYLNQSIDSIINQSIGFEENIQLILVNDGSTDNSENICLEYKNKYPNNIFYITQENKGQAIARNNGLNLVCGEYVTFIDSDDYVEINAFSEVYSFFDTYHEEVDIVAIPIKFFGRNNFYHMLHEKFGETRIIDLTIEPNNPQLSSSSAFFKRELFENNFFPTKVSSSEDTILINKLLFRKKKYGVVNSTTYYYRKRFDESSTNDSASELKDYYIDKLENYFLELINYSLKQEGEVLPFIQYLFAYDLQWILRDAKLDILEEKEQQIFWDYLKKIVYYLDKKCISENRFIRNSVIKSFFMTVKNGGFHKEFEEDTVLMKTENYSVDNLKNHNLWLDIVEIRNNTLYISGFLNNHFKISEISINAIKTMNNSSSHYKGKYVKYTSRKDAKYLSIIWQYKYSFDIKVPLKKGENANIILETCYHKDGNNSNYDEKNLISTRLNILFTKNAKLSSISNYIVKENYLLLFKDNQFNIMNYSFKRMKSFENNVKKHIMDKKIHNYREAINLRSKFLHYYPFIRLFKRFFKIYIFMDRIVSGDDNAEHLYRYAVKQRDNIRKYFVVSEDSPDYNRLKKYGKVIAHKSVKHKLLYLLADKIISTHPYDTQINPFFSYDEKYDERENYSGLVNSQIYFLQHGVTKDNISDWMRKYDKNLSLIVTVNDREKESFYEEGYGFDKSIIQTLGFPRYDNLENNPRKQILIIPTWRKYLKYDKATFVNSKYYEHVKNLLNNEEFVSIAEKNGYNIVFKAHPEFEKYIGDTGERYVDLFDADERIKISIGESYQQLLNDSSLLITDYSSVFFDFAYQKKPVIYYQPSDEYHYEFSYFDYESMGFGEIVKNERNLIELIKQYINSGCIMEDKFKERADGFFKYNDKSNSKRVYDWIKKH